jgi:hypothetical protein
MRYAALVTLAKRKVTRGSYRHEQSANGADALNKSQ